MPVGTEWVLFLEWSAHLDGFVPMLIEQGAVQIIDGRVATKATLHSAWNGRPVENFLSALRR